MKKMLSIHRLAHVLDELSYLPHDLNRLVSDYVEIELWVKTILGERFLGPELLEQVWGNTIGGIPSFPDFTVDDMTVINQGAQDANIVLFCVPELILEHTLTIMTLKTELWAKAKPRYTKENVYNWVWYHNEPFANEPIKPGWYLIRMDVPPETRNKSYTEQQSIIADYKRMGWTTLEVGPAVFGMMLFNLQTGTNKMLNSLDKNTAFCKEVATSGRRVSVAFNQNYGLGIGNLACGFNSADVGCGLFRNILGPGG